MPLILLLIFYIRTNRVVLWFISNFQSRTLMNVRLLLNEIEKVYFFNCLPSWLNDLIIWVFYDQILFLSGFYFSEASNAAIKLFLEYSGRVVKRFFTVSAKYLHSWFVNYLHRLIKDGSILFLRLFWEDVWLDGHKDFIVVEGTIILYGTCTLIPLFMHLYILAVIRKFYNYWL